jgi:hypothetical protein
MEENESNIEAALFLESSDKENSLEIVPSPRLSQNVGPRRQNMNNMNTASSSMQSSKMLRDMDVKFKYPGSSFSFLSLSTQSRDLETPKKDEKTTEPAIDSDSDNEFAELDAWLQSGSNEFV